jgi:hypothetical protein
MHPHAYAQGPAVSRLTFFAAVFAAIATVSLAYAADSPSNNKKAVETPRAAPGSVIVVMPW